MLSKQLALVLCVLLNVTISVCQTPDKKQPKILFDHDHGISTTDSLIKITLRFSEKTKTLDSSFLEVTNGKIVSFEETYHPERFDYSFSIPGQGFTDYTALVVNHDTVYVPSRPFRKYFKGGDLQMDRSAGIFNVWLRTQRVDPLTNHYWQAIRYNQGDYRNQVGIHFWDEELRAIRDFRLDQFKEPTNNAGEDLFYLASDRILFDDGEFTNFRSFSNLFAWDLDGNFIGKAPDRHPLAGFNPRNGEIYKRPSTPYFDPEIQSYVNPSNEFLVYNADFSYSRKIDVAGGAPVRIRILSTGHMVYYENLIRSGNTFDILVHLIGPDGNRVHTLDVTDEFRSGESVSKFNVDLYDNIYVQSTNSNANRHTIGKIAHSYYTYDLTIAPDSVGSVKLDVPDSILYDINDNPNIQAATEILFDNLAPSGYSALASSTSLCQSDTLSVEFTGLELGASLSYTIANETDTLTGAFDIEEDTMSYSWAELGEGFFEFDFELTDSLGNVGETKSFDFSKTSIPDTPAICYVTASDSSNYNQINWDYSFANMRIAVYRETAVTDSLELLHIVENDSQSFYIDTDSDFTNRAYRYAIAAIDSCDYESATSNIHKTIHLTINQGAQDNWNLIWNNYEGVDVATHRILRSADGVEFALLDEVAGSITSYTDNNPFIGFNYYQIEMIIDDCNTAGKFFGKVEEDLAIKSNVVTNGDIVDLVPPDGYGLTLERNALCYDESLIVEAYGLEPDATLNYEILGLDTLSGSSEVQDTTQTIQVDLSAVGEQTFRLWLEDEAGNIGDTVSTTLVRADVPEVPVLCGVSYVDGEYQALFGGTGYHQIRVQEVAGDSVSTFLDGTEDSVFQFVLTNQPGEASVMIAGLDTCEVSSEFSTPHKPMTLAIDSIDNLVQLVWTSYEGITFESYEVLGGQALDAMTVLEEIDSDVTNFVLSEDFLDSLTIFQIALSTEVDCFGDDRRILSDTVSNQDFLKEEIILNVVDFVEKLNIVPNPARDYVSVKGIERGSYSLFNLSGKRIQTGDFRNSLIEFGGVDPGTYLIRLESSDGYKVSQGKLIIK